MRNGTVYTETTIYSAPEAFTQFPAGDAKATSGPRLLNPTLVPTWRMPAIPATPAQLAGESTGPPSLPAEITTVADSPALQGIVTGLVEDLYSATPAAQAIRKDVRAEINTIVNRVTGLHAAYMNALCVGTPVGRRFGCSASWIVRLIAV